MLLLKLEKLNDLEHIIGDFVGIENFQLTKSNETQLKESGLAYKEFLRDVRLPREFFEYYYCDNPYMDHFYSLEEKVKFKAKWEDHIVD